MADPKQAQNPIGRARFDGLKLTRNAGLLAVGLCLGLVFAPTMADVRSDIASGVSAKQAAENAKAAGLSAAIATQNLIDAEVPPAKAVTAVVDVWNTCDDTKAAVGAGVAAAPQSGGDIVQAVSGLRDCRCSSQGLWSLTRVVQRLRPERQRAFVQVAQTCACTAVAVETAVLAAPDYSDRILDAAIRQSNRANRVVDSIGRVGDDPGVGWGSGRLSTANNTIRRNPDVCSGDTDAEDDFDPSAEWDGFGQDTFTGLGNHQADCDNAPEDLFISEYVEGSGENRIVELYNGTGGTIDLESGNYQLAVFYAGFDTPAVTIPLAGEVADGESWYIGHANMPAGLRENAQQLSRGLSFTGADAIVLMRGRDTADCHCAQAAVGAGVRGSSQGTTKFAEETRERYDVDAAGQRGFVVDSVGQVGDAPSNGWGAGQVSTLNRTLNRKYDVCQGDVAPADPYDPRPEWDGVGSPYAGIGEHDSDCIAAAPDLLISEYVETGDNANALELYNATGREIDLQEEGYQVEMYLDGADSPSEVIPLSGVIGPNDLYVLAHPDVPEAVRDRANLITSDIAYDGQDALVLRRLRAKSLLMCQNDVITFLEQPLDDLIYVMRPDIIPIRGPIESDEGDDPPFGGGELASPN